MMNFVKIKIKQNDYDFIIIISCNNPAVLRLVVVVVGRIQLSGAIPRVGGLSLNQNPKRSIDDDEGAIEHDETWERAQMVCG